LFDIFDLNEAQSISTMDLEFAIQCVVMSTSKIFNIGADLDEREITTLVRQYFNEGIRITLPMVLKWASLNPECLLFFSLFKMYSPDMIEVKTLTDNEFITYERYM
jgi:hypothetical protein